MKLIKGSDNIFKDLGFDEAEAENLRLRAEIIRFISALIDGNGWSQAEAAERFRVAQPRISEIKQGKIDLFTIDKLVNMLANVDKKIDIHIRNTAA